MHLRPILQLLENRQFEEDDHCCCYNFKYELFIKAGTRHVRTGPKKKKSLPGPRPAYARRRGLVSQLLILGLAELQKRRAAFIGTLQPLKVDCNTDQPNCT